MPALTFFNRIARFFGYDAVDNRNRRKDVPTILRSEDDELPSGDRRKLLSQTRDLARNFESAAWAIRKHLDFVSSFAFDAKTGIPVVDARLESLMEQWSEECDAQGRHPLSRYLRIAEALRTIDGDVFVVKLATGTLQGIEGDRVRDSHQAPSFRTRPKTIQGVQLDDAGRSAAFAVHKRKAGGGFEFERMVPASNCEQHGYYNRFDQVRGVSPLATAYNRFRDVYENFDYALAKTKVSQLFAIAIFRDTMNSPAPTSESSDSTSTEKRYDIDFGRGPVFLDLDPGDRAEFLENKTPSTEFNEFTRIMIQLALKSLDIPYSFYDEAYTNFFGSRAALMLYIQSAKSKRREVRRLLTRLTRWRIGLWVMDGELELPAGLDSSNVGFDWIPDGIPWWDPSKEIAGDIAAVGATLRSRREIRKEKYGDDWFRVVDELAEENAYLASKGVSPAEPRLSVAVGQPAGGQERGEQDG